MRHSRIIALGFVLLASSSSFGQWEQFRHDRHNTGNNAFENIITTQNVSKLVLNWTFPLITSPSINPINTSPVVSTDVFFPGKTYVLVVDSNNLYALPPVCQGAGCPVNTPVWTFPYQTNQSGCPSSPTVGTVFSSGFGFPESVVYFNDACNAILYAVNLQSGQMRWSQPTLYSSYNYDQVEASPTFSYLTLTHQVVYLAAQYVYAFDADTGIPLSTWHGGLSGHETGVSVDLVNGGVSSSAAGNLNTLFDDDTLFVGGDGSGVAGFLAIDTSNGSTRWKTSQYGRVQNSSPSAPVNSCPQLFCSQTTQFLIAGSFNGFNIGDEIVEFDPQHGTPSPWQFSSTGVTAEYDIRYNSSPAVAAEVIGGQPKELSYVGSTFTWGNFKGLSFTNAYLTALDANTGTPVWQSLMLNPIGFSSPAVANGVVFIADLGGGTTNPQIYAFDAKGIGCQLPSGAPCPWLWSYGLGFLPSTPDLIGSPAVANGMVFETAGPNLYAFGLP
jgi:outer membrane protein assembly factor BamB